MVLEIDDSLIELLKYMCNNKEKCIIGITPRMTSILLMLSFSIGIFLNCIGLHL